MLKTRLGLPANILAAVMYLVALFGGSTLVAPLLLAGYILLFEELNFARRAAVKSMAIVLLVLLANFVICCLPNLLDIFENAFQIFDSSMHGAFTRGLTYFTSTLTGMLSLAEKVLLVLLAVFAVFNKSIDIKPLNKLADK